MKSTIRFSTLLQAFFTQRLMQQKQVSSHTIESYRDTFRLLLKFIQKSRHKQPARLLFEDIDAPLICAFLDDLEKQRGISARSRNVRLAAIRSFFHYAAFEVPSRSEQIQRALAIPTKRYTRTQVGFLTRPEVDALLAAPDRRTWSGRRDHALLLTSVQSGMRLSEMTGLKRQDVTLGTGAHVRVAGKGRKARCIPLTEQARAIVESWLQETAKADSDIVFPNARGGRLSADGVSYILTKHIETARKTCPSLRKKRVTFHQLRHTSAMEMLRAGFDGTMIALWLGHESPETTQIYLDADLELKKKMLEKATPHDCNLGIYRPDDQLLAFLNGL
ncbi:tyrosine-type recombinase/integrase [Paraburkholderia panacisoli]|uniref:Tyrosine-type recombinase/integrase n=1 Tax=Paraburkholderia panacisoli TaxID=2603818 RepID=A0A5B0H3H1_9BURK|nr:site-specific integrase [Paraburkholderia panacisoli]KAA1009660.1 tyrosine-type recombinase/integrase [Paraburkholderia panacisoli]